MNNYRVGIGVDAHTLVDGVPLVLGGVEIPTPRIHPCLSAVSRFRFPVGSPGIRTAT